MEWTALITPNLGAMGLLAVVVLMVLTGRLVPRQNMDDLRTDKDRQIDTWRAAYEAAVNVQNIQREQISALLEAAQTTTHVIQSLPGAPDRIERGPRNALAEAEEA